jgi:hypothetical protein
MAIDPLSVFNATYSPVKGAGKVGAPTSRPLLKITSFDAIYFPVDEMPKPCHAALIVFEKLKNQFSPFSSTTPTIDPLVDSLTQNPSALTRGSVNE